MHITQRDKMKPHTKIEIPPKYKLSPYHGGKAMTFMSFFHFSRVYISKENLTLNIISIFNEEEDL